MRRTLSAQEVAALSEALCARIRATAAYRDAAAVLLYYPVRGEISPLPLLRDREKRFCFPRVETSGAMSARAYTGEWEKGAYGIPAPKADAPCIASRAIDLVIVPGTAFTAALERLGQGGGYYDRFLAVTQAHRMGVAYDFQQVAYVAQHAGDVRMDTLITPTKTWGGKHYGDDKSK